MAFLGCAASRQESPWLALIPGMQRAIITSMATYFTQIGLRPTRVVLAFGAVNRRPLDLSRALTRACDLRPAAWDVSKGDLSEKYSLGHIFERHSIYSLRWLSTEFGDNSPLRDPLVALLDKCHLLLGMEL